MGSTVRLWKIPDGAIKNLTPTKVRDLVEDCLFYAELETLEQAGLSIGAQTSSNSLRRTVRDRLRMAFAENGDIYTRPTLDSLRRLLVRLAAKAESSGTPADITRHHVAQIELLLQALARQMPTFP
jgi:hypothetical protein